ncbi:hypothetical protein [Roseovarius sp. C03]|uniref:hypothetical protein n=1 Tax=Roseovarius sp. C03 TaxID=3449222 RepID=UPI003EDC6BFC
MAYLEANRKAGCHTVDMQATARGLVAGERSERFRLEALTEMVLRIAGTLMVMGSIIMWFFLPVDPDTGRLESFGLAASVIAASGLCVFAYGTRGFRRRMTLDVDAGTLTLTKINMLGHARVRREITLGTVESVYLRRPAQPGGMATLLVRVAGKDAPAIALSGDRHEVEEVHSALCAVLNNDTAPAGQEPVLRVTTPRPRPSLFTAYPRRITSRPVGKNPHLPGMPTPRP